MIARPACHTSRQANPAGINVNHLAALELLQEAHDANPVGFKLGTGADLGLQAAHSYSLISLPRTDRRLIRCRSRRGAG
jgi:hypothetical protein